MNIIEAKEKDNLMYIGELKASLKRVRPVLKRDKALFVIHIVPYSLGGYLAKQGIA